MRRSIRLPGSDQPKRGQDRKDRQGRKDNQLFAVFAIFAVLFAAEAFSRARSAKLQPSD